MKYLKKKLKRKCGKNYFKFELAKWRQKHGLFVFSNACSILELMLCNRNLKNLVYPTRLSSNCRVLAPFKHAKAPPSVCYLPDLLPSFPFFLICFTNHENVRKICMQILKISIYKLIEFYQEPNALFWFP